LTPLSLSLCLSLSPLFLSQLSLTLLSLLSVSDSSLRLSVRPQVVRAAEETAAMLATSISPDQCIKVLCPIIQTADYPMNLVAIKMQTKVIERIPRDGVHPLLPEIVPGLIQGYDNSESSVRKACVFCLVAIYTIIGEELKPHLSLLSSSKLKLLNLYIKRAQSGSSGSDPSADVYSQGL
ncbi:hypothetical protein AAFF_G00242740, partial [Aldrovandia affinis]